MKKLSFKLQIIGIIFFVSFFITLISVFGFRFFNKKSFIDGIIDNETTILTQLAASQDYVASQGGLEVTVQSIKKKYSNHEQLVKEDKDKIMNQVPVVAALKIGKLNAEKLNYKFRVFSDKPRNKDNEATIEEQEIFKRFETDPQLNQLEEEKNGFITLYRPVRISEKQGCLTCHGDPANSPWGNGKDILGFEMENWKDGKLHGVFAISQNIESVMKASTDQYTITPSSILMLAIAGTGFIGLIIAFLLVTPSLNKLGSISQSIQEIMDNLTKESSNIAGSSEKLSEAATEQAAFLQETSASVEEMSSMIEKNSHNAKMTAENSSQTQNKAVEGQRTVERMITSIQQINDSNHHLQTQVSQSNQEIKSITEIIKEIEAKTKVINDIVFQTKLLSFNASVEAARAGEAGKGFSVVAEEVGNLAQLSGKSAQEISELLAASVHKVETIIQAGQKNIDRMVDESTEKISEGLEIANEARDVLSAIVENITSVNVMAAEISEASKEQTTGVNEINKAMHELDSVTQQNAASSTETAHAAENLSSQAESLKESVLTLNKILNG